MLPCGLNKMMWDKKGSKKSIVAQAGGQLDLKPGCLVSTDFLNTKTGK